MEKQCDNCGNSRFELASKRYECSLGIEKIGECAGAFGSLLAHWITKEEFQGFINSETVAEDIAGIIYNQGKAKVFNILESQIEGKDKLGAAKRITEDILANIAKTAHSYLIGTLGDWEQEVTAGGELTPEGEKAAKKEYERVQRIICRK